MYRLVILSIFAVTALAGDLDKNSCIRMFHPHTVSCCKKTADMMEKTMTDELKECLKLPKDPRSCEQEVCIAKIKGIATDDGKLDKAKLKEEMTKEIDDKDLLADIIANCVDGDLEQYGPPDVCDLKKMRHCFSMQVLKNCREWNEFADCNQLKEVVADCVKMVNS